MLLRAIDIAVADVACNNGSVIFTASAGANGNMATSFSLRP